MDMRLAQLEAYIQKRIAYIVAQSGGKPFTGYLRFQMLANSTPGIIHVYASANDASRHGASLKDVWYDTESKQFKALTESGWQEVTDYLKAFSSTVIDLTLGDVPVEVIESIVIEGSDEFDAAALLKGDFVAKLVLSSGRTIESSDIVWEISTPNPLITMSRVRGSNNTVSWAQADLQASESLMLSARYDMIDGQFFKASKVIRLVIAGQQPKPKYVLRVEGPALVNENGVFNYTAILTIDSGDSVKDIDVTVGSSWEFSVPSLGHIVAGELTTGNIFNDVSAQVVAHYIHNGLPLTALLPVMLRNVLPQELTIIGPTSVKENRSATYQANVRFNDGTQRVVVATWDTNKHNVAEINADGVLNAYSVAGNTPVDLTARYFDSGIQLSATKQIVVQNVEAPVLTIEGFSTMQGGATLKLKALLTYDGTTQEVSADWAASPNNFGSFDTEGRFTAKDVLYESLFSAEAGYTFLGVRLTATKPITIFPRLGVVPVKLTIVGGSDVIEEGNAVQFTARVDFNDGSNREVIAVWSLLPNETGILDSFGHFEAPAVTADRVYTVKASYSDNGVHVEDQRNVTVRNIPDLLKPQAIEITGSSTILEQQTSQYALKVTMTDGTVKTVNASSWSSKNTGVADIDTTGKLTAQSIDSDQQVVIEADYTEAGVTLYASKTISVKDSARPLSLAVSGASFVTEGQSTQLLANVTLSDGSVLEVTQDSEWLASNLMAVTINKGFVTALQVDVDTPVTLTARYTLNSVTVEATHLLNVKDIVVAQSLVIEGADQISEGTGASYTARLKFSNNTFVDVTPVWSTDNNQLAPINTAGRVNAGLVPSDTPFKVKANYTYQGQIFTGEKPVTIINGFGPAKLDILGPDTIVEFESGQFIAEVTMSDGVTKKQVIASFLIDNPSMGSISTDSFGTMTLQTKQVSNNVTGQITASYSESGNTVTATKLVTVVNIYVQSLKIEPVGETINSGATLQYKATAAYSDGSTKDVSAYTSWSTSNAGVATIGSAGLLTAKNLNMVTTIDVLGTYSEEGRIVTDKTSLNVLAGQTTYSIQGATNVYEDDLSTGRTFVGKQTLPEGQINTVANGTWTVSGSDTAIANSGVIINATTGVLDAVKATELLSVNNQPFNLTVNLTVDSVVVATKAITVTPVVLVSVSVSGGASTLVAGSSYNFVAQANFNSGKNQSITTNALWSLAPASLGVVEQTGRVTAASTPNDQTGSVVAEYSFRGVTKQGLKAVSLAGVVSMTGLEIVGAADVIGGKTSTYVVNALYDNGTKKNVTSSSTLTVAPTAAGSIAGGIFSAAPVASDTPAVLGASYTEAGVTKTANFNVLVHKVEPISITISPANPTVQEGKTQQFTATATMNNGQVKSVNPVWSFDTPSQGSISSSGLFTAVEVTANGQGTLTASYTENGTTVTATTKVNVQNVSKPVSIALSGGGASVYEGQSLTWTAAVTMDDGTVKQVTNVSLNFPFTVGSFAGLKFTANTNLSGDAAVWFEANYTENGVTITSAKQNFTVRDVVPVSVEVTGPTSVAKSGTATYTGKLVMNDGTKIAGTFTWALNNGQLGTINTTTGVLTAAAATEVVTGQVQAYSQTYGLTGVLDITVQGQPALAQSAVVNGATTVQSGSPSSYSLDVTFDDATKKTFTSDARVTWSLTGAPSGTTISSSGVLSTNQVAADTTITVTGSYTENGVTKSGSLNVLLKKPASAALEPFMALAAINLVIDGTTSFINTLKSGYLGAGTLKLGTAGQLYGGNFVMSIPKYTDVQAITGGAKAALYYVIPTSLIDPAKKIGLKEASAPTYEVWNYKGAPTYGTYDVNLNPECGTRITYNGVEYMVYKGPSLSNTSAITKNYTIMQP